MRIVILSRKRQETLLEGVLQLRREIDAHAPCGVSPKALTAIIGLADTVAGLQGMRKLADAIEKENEALAAAIERLRQTPGTVCNTEEEACSNEPEREAVAGADAPV